MFHAAGCLMLVLSMSQVDLNERTYAGLRTEILPSKEELKWRQMPWRPTLAEGVRDAYKERKPILLYVMNGHPLGCT